MKPAFNINMNLFVSTVLLLCFVFLLPAEVDSQTDSDYSFLVAGHAYGAHAGTNIGLHPPLLKKLSEVQDTALLGIFLTGDIVNQSTTASWNKVQSELAALELQSFYVMGNHDNNTLGHQIFKQKHGGDYYAFVYGNDLFIALNSTESDRSISPVQLEFLDNILKNTDSNWERAFIFFHEIIWNSNEKYKLVRSNSRSRYSQLVNISNFWTEVFPKMAALAEKKFFLFAGDVGGNPDAIAASLDRWNNVTLVSSGMGEVIDENFLKVNVSADTVTFDLIPLNDTVEMHPLPWYNIPEKPDSISGADSVSTPFSGLKYNASPVWNATGYRWKLVSEISGVSDSASIVLDFTESFVGGEISVKALNDGFGESQSTTFRILKNNSTSIIQPKIGTGFEVSQNQKYLEIRLSSQKNQLAQLRIIDVNGRVVYTENFRLTQGINNKTIDKISLFQGVFIAEIRTGNERFSKKCLIY